ncbi:hypothetical protein KSP40_PGU022458 [Platanthera guangdongensis]|uniref:Ubiquitin-like protease family profile domain-containing protein n=1 Tax=Platanthera guangdongensis TaxID=2320717 RepID=A0ABR2M6M8_9ASPA
MPMHYPSHWTLLTCNLKEEMWYYYDSMPQKMPQLTLQSMVCCVQLFLCVANIFTNVFFSQISSL